MRVFYLPVASAFTLALALAGCGADDAPLAAQAATPKPLPIADGTPSAERKAAPATAAEAPPAAAKIYLRGEDITDDARIDAVRVAVDSVRAVPADDSATPVPAKSDKKGSVSEPPLQLWRVSVTITNEGKTPIDGVNVIAGLYGPRSVDVFASQSESRLFDTPLGPGQSRKDVIELRSRGAAPTVGAVAARVVLSGLPTRKEAPAGWKPLDPKKAESRVVATRQTPTAAAAASKPATNGRTAGDGP